MTDDTATFHCPCVSDLGRIETSSDDKAWVAASYSVELLKAFSVDGCVVKKETYSRRCKPMSAFTLTRIPVARHYWVSLCGKQARQPRGSPFVSWITRSFRIQRFALDLSRFVCSPHSMFSLISLPSTPDFTNTIPYVIWLMVTWRQKDAFLSYMLVTNRVYKLPWSVEPQVV